LSPSSSIECAPIVNSFDSKPLAIVDLPAPERPVSHTTAPRCAFSAARSSGLTLSA